MCMAKTRGAIAAGHPQTVEAGLEMFRLGGNAFDAAIASVLASFITEPALTSPAGGGFLLAHTAQNQQILFDFFAQTPRQKQPLDQIDFYPIQVDFGTAVQEFHVGLGSMAVPGAIAGVFHVHQRLGRLPLHVVAEPAIHYAKYGIGLSELQAYCFDILSPILLADDAMKAVVAPHGTLLKAGDQLRMTDLADTLTYLINHGAREFYEGDIAHQLVRDCQIRGGYLTLDDLRHYQVIERTPLTTQYRGKTLLTNPPPSSGGALIAFSLALLSMIDVGRLDFGSAEHISILAHAMSLTNQARTDGYDQHLYDPDILHTFLSADHLSSYRHLFSSVTNKWGSTTHISVLDEDGNAASVTASNGEGASYVIPGTGIMMNNMLGEADLHPTGFHHWRENVRISSMMAPTIVLGHDYPEIVTGSGGSNRIRTAILQIISNLIDFKMPVNDAVNRGRIHWENGVLNLEPGFDVDVDAAMLPADSVILPWSQHNLFFGGVHTVTQLAPSQFEGAGDRRRSGAFAQCD
ncbi:MAG: gamma-glutamyltransferase [Elainellaceae cyanobacterium]